jgi:butyrate kinase
MQFLIADAVLIAQLASPLGNTGRVLPGQADTIVTAGCVEYNRHSVCEAILQICLGLALDA